MLYLNQLTGSIPSELSALTSLTWLWAFSGRATHSSFARPVHAPLVLTDVHASFQMKQLSRLRVYQLNRGQIRTHFRLFQKCVAQPQAQYTHVRALCAHTCASCYILWCSRFHVSVPNWKYLILCMHIIYILCLNVITCLSTWCKAPPTLKWCNVTIAVIQHMSSQMIIKLGTLNMQRRTSTCIGGV